VLTVSWAVIAALGPAPALAQPARPPTPVARAEASPPGDSADLPVSLDRIRRGLAQADTLQRAAARQRQPMFRIEVDGELPSFSTFIAEGESLASPAPWGGMTHAEFLTMVTPPQARAFGASTNGDLLQVLATSLLGGYAIQGASALIGKVPDLIRQGREAAARREVQQALADLERRRREADARAREADAERRRAEEAGLVEPRPPVPPS
jgi:hypothetical protein